MVAAVERFIADTAPPPPPPATRPNPWQRAALLEGARAKEAVVSPWGEPLGWETR